MADKSAPQMAGLRIIVMFDMRAKNSQNLSKSTTYVDLNMVIYSRSLLEKRSNVFYNAQQQIVSRFRDSNLLFSRKIADMWP